jgi:hypothetical protein
VKQLLMLACRYIASGRTTEKTRPLPSNGCSLFLCRCLVMGLCVTIFIGAKKMSRRKAVEEDESRLLGPIHVLCYV